MEIPATPASCVNVVQTGGPASGSVFVPGDYTISFQATDACGNVTNCSFNINVAAPQQGGGNNVSYCDAAGNDSSVVWIENVSFGQLHNQSGNNGGYQQFSGCVPFPRGVHQNLSLTPKYAAYPSADAFWSVYIDYNQDGDFSDPGEFIATGNGTSTLSGIIVIPTSAYLGDTRLRVIMSKGAVAKNSCASFAFGEVEDYCITIVKGSGVDDNAIKKSANDNTCLLYTSPSPRDLSTSRMPSSA